MRWLLIVDQLNDSIGEAELSVGIFPFGSYPWITDEGIIRTKNQCHCIEQKQFLLHASEGT